MCLRVSIRGLNPSVIRSEKKPRNTFLVESCIHVGFLLLICTARLINFSDDESMDTIPITIKREKTIYFRYITDAVKAYRNSKKLRDYFSPYVEYVVLLDLSKLPEIPPKKNRVTVWSFDKVGTDADTNVFPEDVETFLATERPKDLLRKLIKRKLQIKQFKLKQFKLKQRASARVISHGPIDYNVTAPYLCLEGRIKSQPYNYHNPNWGIVPIEDGTRVVRFDAGNGEHPPRIISVWNPSSPTLHPLLCITESAMELLHSTHVILFKCEEGTKSPIKVGLAGAFPSVEDACEFAKSNGFAQRVTSTNPAGALILPLSTIANGDAWWSFDDDSTNLFPPQYGQSLLALILSGWRRRMRQPPPELWQLIVNEFCP